MPSPDAASGLEMQRGGADDRGQRPLGLARVRGATRGTDGMVGRRAVCGSGFVGAVFASRLRKVPPLLLDMSLCLAGLMTSQCYLNRGRAQVQRAPAMATGMLNSATMGDNTDGTRRRNGLKSVS